ncbi:kinesin-like protein KIF14 [Pseudophryne corroboree]|uniref:kinesin-like protein KIF14 n=1 Tax=Pseudophryne corroboree TaxID=495146 RepID=UPI003081B468
MRRQLQTEEGEWERNGFCPRRAVCVMNNNDCENMTLLSSGSTRESSVKGDYIIDIQINTNKGRSFNNLGEEMLHPGHHPTDREKNRTFIISDCKSVASPTTLKPETNLKLQRRETIAKGSPQVEQGLDCNGIQSDEPDKRLTLQRRMRTGSIEKEDSNKNPKLGVNVKTVVEKQNVKYGLPPAKAASTECSSQPEFRSKGLCSVNGKLYQPKSILNSLKVENLHVNGTSADVRLQTVKATKGKDFMNSPNSLGHDFVKASVPKNGCVDKQKTPKNGATGLLRSASIRDMRSPVLTPKRPVGTLPATNRKNLSTVDHVEKTLEASFPHVKDETSSINPNAEDDPHKAQNCAVTVAVRVRPFSTREIKENDIQVVSMTGQETVVQHPESKQTHRFQYDFSFWSFEKSSPNYVDQEKVYEKLAVPLLEWSLLGYNTCLFAYGQTGSGKSYTMMGFEEELGIIPRFCEHLFSRIQSTKQQVSFHMEISYFEVYNEKIHDLLVFKAENGQKKQPLRVREHPLLGPYVEELSTNVVSSYQDIQSWLELGNKQRATAATGMNDKSSRSHSVFTLIMTQTKTEIVDGEEHDHRITSRINLVDLAGSERCTSAKTSGERLKEGVSINKSLLTLGKVISALSDSSQARKKVFIPYRESVLTWLLKESLGGNSKTAMIATISPAVGNIEETLSTLRYAKQARLIINIAKVNEDMNAKLIRDLKSEIEKLKAAQLSAKNRDSSKYRHCHQEITSLKLKLSQQEKEMSELHRVWKEKLDQAEQRKREETKELQKAGITFKMDNRLPNLVNLNEDPQLSEMLLYMIKEGKTTVGKYRAGSSHDIQLSGALIAEDHCIITNIDNTVCISPSGDARTYVNGNQISSSTVLHHGDRVILGGDHYFRFNHPVEVRRLKAPATVSKLSAEGPKDFDFAKNELLKAQRSQLEEEIEEARLRAKEELMQEIQIAKEMAQHELTSQRSAYEDKIRALEVELKEESLRKQQQEMSSQRAASKIQELEEVKMHLQQEVHINKKRLEMEAIATKQALEDHKIRHAKILQALEDEKQKIAKEVQMLQQEKNISGRNASVNPTWNSLKLSVMIQEANTISAKLRKHTVFSRRDVTNKENLPGNALEIQVKNIKLGIVMFWSVEKFEYKLAAMKDLYENNGSTKDDDDVFYDPGDEWEPDLSKSSISNFSRRRSKSLMRNKRISGCLYEIRVHPIQSLQSGHSSGLMNKSSSFLSKSSSSVCSNPTDSHLPGICKDLIGSALDYLGQCHADERNLADSLIHCVQIVCTGVHAVSQAYEQQDEDSTDALFLVNHAAQTHSVRLTSAFQQLVVLTKHWLELFPDSRETSKVVDSLALYIKKLGGYLQLLLQGCCSDILAMVTEAKGKANHLVEQILQSIGNLAALTAIDLHLPEEERTEEHGLQKSITDILYSGMLFGLESLIDCGLKASDGMQTDIQRCCVHEEVLLDLKKSSNSLASFIQSSLISCKKLNLDMLIRDSDVSVRHSLYTGLWNLKNGVDLLRNTVISLLKGSDTDASHILSSLNDINSSASEINKSFLALSLQVISLTELRVLSEALSGALHKRDCDQPSVRSSDALTSCVFSPSSIQWV